MTTRNMIGWILGLLLAVNGGAMLAWPLAWYTDVPGVSEHGAFNSHFVRDIGVVNLIAGASMFWVARRRAAWPAAMAGALFLAVHALIHAIEAAGGHVSPGTAMLEVPPLVILAALALWVAWPPRAA